MRDSSLVSAKYVRADSDLVFHGHDSQRTHRPLTHTIYQTLRQIEYIPSGSGLPQQCTRRHNQNCFGTTPGV